jgi:hypothetical protein
MNLLVKKASVVLLSSLTILSSSCSTILQGSKKDMTIQSLTPGSKIYVNGDEMGKDLVDTRLRRNKNHTIMIKKDGYETRTVTLQKNAQAGYIVADALLALTGFGLIFIIVDAATGSWHTFDKDKVVVDLEPKK